MSVIYNCTLAPEDYLEVSEQEQLRYWAPDEFFPANLGIGLHTKEGPNYVELSEADARSLKNYIETYIFNVEMERWNHKVEHTPGTVTFDDLNFQQIQGPTSAVKIQAIHEFDNGYGVSIIRGEFSYGGEQGLYELAVTLGGHVCYDTPVTQDVIGYLTPEAITLLLRKVEALDHV